MVMKYNAELHALYADILAAIEADLEMYEGVQNDIIKRIAVHPSTPGGSNKERLDVAEGLLREIGSYVAIMRLKKAMWVAMVEAEAAKQDTSIIVDSDSNSS
jgi:hypothetical protein